MGFYPTIRDETIMTFEIVIQNMEENPEFLDAIECHYSDTVKNFFRKRVGVGVGAVVGGDIFLGKDELYVLDEQVTKVLSDLESFGQSLGRADVNEKAAYFRVKTSLLEKLITMKERIVNLKEINDFKTIILGFMGEILSKDQITTLMQRLDGVLGTKNDDIL